MSGLRVSTYVISTGVAVLGVQRLVAGTAVWPTLPHDVTLAAQGSLALKATEVLHVPVSSFCLRTLVCQNNLGLRDSRGGLLHFKAVNLSTKDLL